MNAVLKPVPREATGRHRWQARLEVGFGERAGRTVPVHRRHDGPLAIQRAFYPEGPVCHLYLLHPPGGLVGGDGLDITLEAAAQTHALLTTPGATKFYRSLGEPAEQVLSIRVAADSAVEWFPQESIYFDGCIAGTRARIQLEPGARFIGWETTVLGRPASGDEFTQGTITQRLDIYRDGEPLFLDAVQLTGDSELRTGVAGLDGRTAMATMVATPVDAEWVAMIRERVKPRTGERFAVTLKDDLLVCRFIGDQALHARHLFEQVWRILRPLMLGRPACPPRIWST